MGAARNDDLVHAGTDRSGCGGDRGEARRAVAVHGGAGDVLEPGLDGDVPSDVAAAVQRFGEDDVVHQLRVETRALDGGNDDVFGQVEGVDVDQGALVGT